MTFLINGKQIGSGQPCYLIAEISANHNGSYAQALALVEAAKEAGADAVKLQTYTPETMTLNSHLPHFKVSGGTLWDGRTLYDLYEEAYTPWDWQPKLKAAADVLGLTLFSTPFDATAVEFLEALHVPAYKIASFELVDIALIQRVARTGKPIILSTGMATLAEIEDAVAAAREAGTAEIALLHCNSGYPAPPSEMNLRTIPDLAARFGVPAGLSDHTLDPAVSVAAVTLGACILEKHFTLSRSVPGPDSAFSLEPAEFRAMVDAVRVAEQALGQVHYGVSAAEEKSIVFRRSLWAVTDIKAGEALTAENVRALRPGHGLLPKFLPDVLGREASQDIERGTPLSWDLVEG